MRLLVLGVETGDVVGVGALLPRRRTTPPGPSRDTTPHESGTDRGVVFVGRSGGRTCLGSQQRDVPPGTERILYAM